MGVTPRAAASRKFPMQFLCDYANAVIDRETGEIMEYRHLLKNPKHRKRWQKAFSREIRRLATITETIKFVLLSEILKDRLKDQTYARKARESGARSNPSHDGGRSNQLPWRLWNTNSQPPDSQVVTKQRNIDSACKVHDDD